MRQRLPIATKNSQGRSLKLSAELLTNMYAEQAPDGARSQVVAVGCPGAIEFTDISTSLLRGVYWVSSNKTLWVVCGLVLFKVSAGGVATSVGAIGGFGRVSMSDNGVQLVITTEAITYIVTLATDTLTAVTDSDFPNADTVAFLGGYFFFNNNQTGSSGQLFWSEIYEGTTYDALDFATAENVPDNLVAVWRDHDRLLLFGDDTIESWFLTGGSEIVAPYKGSVINRGLGARWSVANVDNSVIFLDDSGIVRRIGGQGGYSAERISTHALENDIAKGNWKHNDADAYDGAVASSYIEEGHEFYVLTIPGLSTWVFDAATGVWHKRKSKGLDASRMSFHVKAHGYNLAGDTELGKLYIQSLDYKAENDEDIVAEIEMPALNNQGDRFRVHELELGIDVDHVELETTITETNTFNLDIQDVPWSTFGESFYNVGAGSETSGPLKAVNQRWFTGYMGGLRVTDNVARYYPNSNAQITVPTTQFPVGDSDPYWDDVVTCLHFDGDDGSTSFTDEKGNTVDTNGNVVHSNTTSKWGTTSGYFDGVDDWLKVNLASAEVGTLGTTYTIEAWIYLTQYLSPDGHQTAILGAGPVGVGDKDMYLTVGSSGYIAMPWNDTGLGNNYETIVGDSVAVPLNQWSHIAVVRYAELGTVIIYVDGEIATLGATSTDITVDSTANTVVTDPKIMLDAKSEGNKFDDMTQQMRDLPKVGEHGKRIIWRRLGQHREFTPRFTISSRVGRVIYEATARISTDG